MFLQIGPLEALFGQGIWTNYTIENTIMVDSHINDILIIDGVKWIGTNWGLYSFDNTTWLDYSEYLPNKQVRSISIDNNGVLYVSTISGIAVYDGQDWSQLTPSNSILPGHINKIIFDNNNVGYIGSINGLYKFENDIISLVLDSSSLESEFINVSTLTFKGDSLCIGTVNGGLAYLYNDSINWYNSANGLIDNTSTDLLVHEENLWITAPYAGLIAHLLNENFIVFNNEVFQNWPSNSLNCITSTSKGIFIGSDGGGFFEFSYQGGIQNTTTYTTQNSSLIDNTVLCISEGDDGFWIGTETGLVNWKENSNIQYSQNNDNSIFSLKNDILSLKTSSTVLVYSINGQQVINKESVDKINLSSLKTGFYILSINNNHRLIQVD